MVTAAVLVGGNVFYFPFVATDFAFVFVFFEYVYTADPATDGAATFFPGETEAGNADVFAGDLPTGLFFFSFDSFWTTNGFAARAGSSVTVSASRRIDQIVLDRLGPFEWGKRCRLVGSIARTQ